MDKVIAFFKKQSLGFYFSIAAAVFALIATIIYLYNSNGAYFEDTSSTVVILSFLAIAFCIILPVLGVFAGDKNYLSVLYILSVIFLTYALMQIVNARSTLMGYLWFSELESGNPVAVAAMNQAVASWIFYGLAIISCIAAGFNKLKKED